MEIRRSRSLYSTDSRGAYPPELGEFGDSLPTEHIGTILPLRFTGGLQWRAFCGSPEALDRLPHPLDRWCRRVVGLLAAELCTVAIYPNGSPAALSFQRFAERCEPVHRSPIGLLIHYLWGLWHAHRDALLFGSPMCRLRRRTVLVRLPRRH